MRFDQIVNSDLLRFAQDIEGQADAISDEDVVRSGMINRRSMLRHAASCLREAHAELEQLGATELVAQEVGKYVDADDPRAAFAALVGAGVVAERVHLAGGATAAVLVPPAAEEPTSSNERAAAIARGLEVLRSVPVPEGFKQEPAFEAAFVAPPPDKDAEAFHNTATWKHAYDPAALTDEERAHLRAQGVDVP